MWIEIKKDVFEESDIKGINYLFQILSWYPQNSIPRYEFVIDYNEVADVEGFINLSQIENTGNVNNNFVELLEIQFNRWIENGVSNSFL